jgi:hypothetical protein
MVLRVPGDCGVQHGRRRWCDGPCASLEPSGPTPVHPARRAFV